MRIILVIIVFVALKFWELIKFIGCKLLDLWLMIWIPMTWAILIIIGLVLVIVGWVYLVQWQYELFNGVIHSFVIILYNGFIFYGIAKFIHYVYKYWDYEVSPFIKVNWDKANIIVDKVWNKKGNINEFSNKC
jgi:hypothetical protein